jgi:hypothetical protein
MGSLGRSLRISLTRVAPFMTGSVIRHDEIDAVILRQRFQGLGPVPAR